MKLLTYATILFGSKNRIKLLSETDPDLLTTCMDLYQEQTACDLLDANPSLAQNIDSNDVTPLIYATKYNFTKLALKLVDLDYAGLNITDRSSGINLIGYAIKNKMLPLIHKLVHNDIILNIDNIMDMLKSFKFEQIIHIMLKSYVYSIICANYEQVLEYCVMNNIVFVKLITDFKGKLDMVLANDETLLHMAIQNENSEIVRLLLLNDCDANYIDVNGNTYLLSICKIFEKKLRTLSSWIMDKDDICHFQFSAILAIITYLLLVVKKNNVSMINKQGETAINLFINLIVDPNENIRSIMNTNNVISVYNKMEKNLTFTTGK